MLTAAPIPEFAPRRCGAVVVLDDVTEFARLDELRGVLPHLQQIATLLGNVSLAEKQIASLNTQKETAQRDLKQLDSDILKNRDKRALQQSVIGKSLSMVFGIPMLIRG